MRRRALTNQFPAETSLCGKTYWPLATLFLLAMVVGCQGSDDKDAVTNEDTPQETCNDPLIDANEDGSEESEPVPTGFEIIEDQSPTSARAWVSPYITFSEFEALELPENWVKNQPRESAVCGADEGRFIKSPDGAEDGDYLLEEHFGFRWLHAATVTERDLPLDEGGLLRGFKVKKYHQLTYEAGSCMILLVSPEGKVYFRIGRDATRTCNTPTLPDDWRLVDYVTPETLVIQLFDENLVIRTDNQDSFQGPVPQLEGAL